MKRAVLALLIILITGFFFFIYDPANDAEILMNDQYIVLIDPVIIEDGKLLIPAKLLFNELGAETEWDNENRILSALLGDYKLELPVGSNNITIDDEITVWDSEVKMFNDIIYVPVRASAETLKAFIEWDDQTKTIQLSKPIGSDPKLEDDNGGPPLHVAYPPVSQFRYYANSLFVFGTTKPYAQVEVKVNGKPVEILDPRTGNFLTMVSIPRGEEIVIRVEATDSQGTTTVERSVIYPAGWQAMPGEPLAVHPTNLIPGEDQILGPGDSLKIAFQGSPGAEAKFWFGSEENKIAMTEIAYPSGPPGTGGIYTVKYTINSQDLPDSGSSEPLPITIILQKDGEQVSRELPGKITFTSENPYKVLEVRGQDVIKNRGWLYIVRDNNYQLHAGTLGGTGYPTNVVGYLIGGTRFEAKGTSGDYYRVKVNDIDTFLIHKTAVREVTDKDTLDPTLLRLDLSETGEKMSLRLSSSERFPFLIEDGTNKLKVKLYGIEKNEILSMPSLTPAVKDLKLERCVGDCDASMNLTVELDYFMTGFEPVWVDNQLLLNIYKPQEVNRDNPLKNKTIIVDPGHGGRDIGAIGPGDVHEKDVVLAMSLYLRDLLAAEGANVIMTRTEDVFVNLYDRPERINDYDADLFISVHVNAHAHGARAVDIRGLMILYNYDHNQKLAEIMLDTMEAETDLPAFRTWRRKIAVLRHPQIPSVLVEAGYMMHPEDYWHIFHPSGQIKIARAMMEGIKEYFLSLDYQYR